MRILGVSGFSSNKKNNSFGINNSQSFNAGIQTRFQARIVPSAANSDKFEIVTEKVQFDPLKEQKFARENTIRIRHSDQKNGYREIIS